MPARAHRAAADIDHPRLRYYEVTGELLLCGYVQLADNFATITVNVEVSAVVW
jgi:hypothetical protein